MSIRGHFCMSSSHHRAAPPCTPTARPRAPRRRRLSAWARRRRQRPALTPLPRLGAWPPPGTCSPGCGASSRSHARRRELGSGPGLAGSGKVTAKCWRLAGRRRRGCGRLSPCRRDALRFGLKLRSGGCSEHTHSCRTGTVCSRSARFAQAEWLRCGCSKAPAPSSAPPRAPGTAERGAAASCNHRESSS